MPIKPLTPDSFKDVPPCGIRLQGPATDAQRQLLSAAGYAQVTETAIKDLGLGNLPGKENIWWQTRPNPDLIPREELFADQHLSDQQIVSCHNATREERTRELDIDLER